MKKSKTFKRKGIIPALSTVAMFAIFTLAFVLASILPVVFLKIHIVGTVVSEYKYNSAQQALQTLMSITVPTAENGETIQKRASKIVGEYLAGIGSEEDISFLKEKLDTMVENSVFECYKLYAENPKVTLAEKKCASVPTYKSIMLLVTPEDVKRIALAID